jgi:hypothetical protein
MKAQIEARFPNCAANNCHATYRNLTIQVIEPHNGKCIIDNAHSHANFIIQNPNAKEIHFVAIDSCVFIDNTHKKCDCIVYDDAFFCFIEIKDTDNANLGSRRKNLSKAYKQLETTITMFSADLNFGTFALEAIVAFRDRPLRPVASATNQYQRLRFQTLFNVDLKIGNEKTFI